MKRIILTTSAMLLLVSFAKAQEKTTLKDSTSLPTVVVSGTKYPEQQKNIVQKIDVISAKQIAATNAPSTGDLLMQSGQVFVQKSQLGGSSPSIRGFEANRVLLVIDGVRMNNAVYRGGHLQNVITIDQSMLENVEILNGPASTLYGSDALGGVFNFTSKKIKFNDNNSNAYARYSSACNEFTLHGDVNIANNKIGSITSITASKFGDLRAGANRTSVWGDVGLKKYYVQQFNGVDSMVANANPQKQLGSGYSQIDLLEKIAIKSSEHIMHLINLQYSTSTDVPRYDRSTDMSSGKLKFAEWYYGPQKRGLIAYRMEGKNLKGFFNDATINVNYQNIFESRINRRFGKTALISNVEKINVFGFDFNARHMAKSNEMIVGIDGQYNSVNSKGTSTNIKTNEVTLANSRYPDGGNKYQMFGAYIQDIFKITPNKIVLNAGIRFNIINLSSNFTNTTPLTFPYSSFIQKNNGLTGNLGIAFTPKDNLKISIGYCSGFKAPNVDEAGRLFESSNGSLVVPNADLKPEYAHNFDLGFSYNERNKYIFQTNVFYTSLSNAIVMDNFKFNGSDSSNFYGSTIPVVALQNSALAKIYGVSANAKFDLVSDFVIAGTITYTAGKYDAVGTKDNGTAIVPMDHIPPVFGRVGLMYNKQKYNVEFYSLFNGKKDIANYNPLPASEDNIQYAIAGYGMPAWATINLKGAYIINNNFTVQAGLENILDTHYRHFASGISAPGINAILALRMKI